MKKPSKKAEQRQDKILKLLDRFTDKIALEGAVSFMVAEIPSGNGEHTLSMCFPPREEIKDSCTMFQTLYLINKHAVHYREELCQLAIKIIEEQTGKTVTDLDDIEDIPDLDIPDFENATKLH